MATMAAAAGAGIWHAQYMSRHSMGVGGGDIRGMLHDILKLVMEIAESQRRVESCARNAGIESVSAGRPSDVMSDLPRVRSVFFRNDSQDLWDDDASRRGADDQGEQEDDLQSLHSDYSKDLPTQHPKEKEFHKSKSNLAQRATSKDKHLPTQTTNTPSKHVDIHDGNGSPRASTVDNDAASPNNITNTNNNNNNTTTNNSSSSSSGNSNSVPPTAASANQSVYSKKKSLLSSSSFSSITPSSRCSDQRARRLTPPRVVVEQDRVSFIGSPNPYFGQPLMEDTPTTSLPIVRRASQLADWPATVQMRAQMKMRMSSSRSLMSERVVERMRAPSTFHPKRASFIGYMHTMDLENTPFWKRLWPVDPNSQSMLFFDILGIIVLSHDILVTTYVVSLDVDVVGMFAGFAVLSTLYWLLDFMLRWVTGFYQSGELNMSLPKIRWHYLSTWCIPDLTLLLCDFTAHALQYWGGSADGAENRQAEKAAIRVTKFLRVMRIARLSRLVQKMNKISALGLSTNTRTLVHGFNILWGVLIYNHLVCCTWCAIGKQLSSESGLSWVDYPSYGRITEDGTTLRDVEPVWLYLTGFHWTLAQMTPGPIDIVATNFAEKVFNIVLLVVGLMFGSLIVSLFSGHIMQHIIKRRNRMNSVEAVRRFLRENSISTSLCVQVQKQVIERLTVEPALKLKDVTALSLLSSTLKQDLILESRLPSLISHPVFRIWGDMDSKGLRSLCLMAADSTSLCVQDELFRPQTMATHAFHLSKGRMVYSQVPETSIVEEVRAIEVPTGTWISEAALWSHWDHQGTLEAASNVQLVQVSADGVQKALLLGDVACTVVRQYGINFHRRIVAASPPHAAYPDDLLVPHTSPSQLLSFHVSLGLLERGHAGGTVDLTMSMLEELREEIRKEQCSIQRSPTGDLERVLSIVILRLSRIWDSAILARVGTFSEEKGFVGKADLPATKLRCGEAPRGALQRLIGQELGGLANDSELLGARSETTSAMSLKYGMNTIYYKTIHTAAVRTTDPDEDDIPAVFFGFGRSRTPQDCPIPDRHIYHVYDSEEGRTALFAWVSEAELEHLKTPEGKDSWDECLNIATLEAPVDSV